MAIFNFRKRFGSLLGMLANVQFEAQYRLLASILMLVALVVIGSAHVWAQPAYTITDLGTIGNGNAYAIAITSDGKVFGNVEDPSTTPHTFTPFMWTQSGGMVSLGTLGGPGGAALRAVSDTGQAVGWGITPSGSTHAWSWTQTDGMVDLGSLGGDYSYAYDVNNNGKVVGQSSDGSGTPQAFVWSKSSGMVVLPPPQSNVVAPELATAINDDGIIAGQWAFSLFAWLPDGSTVSIPSFFAPFKPLVASAINGSGQVVGATGALVFSVGNTSHAFSWTQAGGFVDIGALSGASDTIAVSVNAAGQVAGNRISSIPSFTPLQVTHAFFWTATGGMTDLGTLGSGISAILASSQVGTSPSLKQTINDNGQVVGQSDVTSSGPKHAFVWTLSGGMIDLGTLGGSESGANAINSTGQIVGYSTLTPTGTATHATLWQANPFKQVSAGFAYTCGLRTSGSIECWGNNASQQAPALRNASVGQFTSVTAGALHTCGLNDTGVVECWGNNVVGQAPATRTAASGNFTEVSAGLLHTCALRTDGTVECWGFNGSGQAPATRQAQTGSFIHVSAGGSHTCAVRDDGAVECWGNNANGQAPAVRNAAVGTFFAVSAGAVHTCATRSAGLFNPQNAVECWGNNLAGQAPPLRGGSYFVVSAGTLHSCGISVSNQITHLVPPTLSCWGNNSYGQAPPTRTPTTGGGNAFVMVSAGGLHTCAINRGQFVECWGNNTYGQAPAVKH